MVGVGILVLKAHFLPPWEETGIEAPLKHAYQIQIVQPSTQRRPKTLLPYLTDRGGGPLLHSCI